LSGYTDGPEQESIPGSTLELPSPQPAQLSDWAYDQQVAYAAYQRKQHTQDPAEQQQQADASAEDSAAEPPKMKRCRSTTSKSAKKQRRSADSKPARKRSRPTAASRRRPILEPLEQPLQVVYVMCFSSTVKRAYMAAHT
jgi:hypothetical protein